MCDGWPAGPAPCRTLAHWPSFGLSASSEQPGAGVTDECFGVAAVGLEHLKRLVPGDIRDLDQVEKLRRIYVMLISAARSLWLELSGPG